MIARVFSATRDGHLRQHRVGSAERCAPSSPKSATETASPNVSHHRGSTFIQRNIVAEPILGLPRG
jgi:hypothetical protein